MRELLFLITLVLGVAIGFAGCGDDDDKTDAPVESSVDAGGEVAESDTGGSDAAGEEAAGGTGGEAAEEEATGGTAGEDTSEADAGAEAE